MYTTHHSVQVFHGSTEIHSIIELSQLLLSSGITLQYMHAFCLHLEKVCLFEVLHTNCHHQTELQHEFGIVILLSQ